MVLIAAWQKARGKPTYPSICAESLELEKYFGVCCRRVDSQFPANTVPSFLKSLSFATGIFL